MCAYVSQDQATTAQDTAEVLSETNLDAAAVDSDEGPTASMLFTSGSTPPEVRRQRGGAG